MRASRPRSRRGLVAERDANLTRLGVVSSDGTVYLSGTVPSTEQKALAATVAKGVSGVRRVVNALEVRPGARVARPTTRASAPGLSPTRSWPKVTMTGSLPQSLRISPSFSARCASQPPRERDDCRASRRAATRGRITTVFTIVPGDRACNSACSTKPSDRSRAPASTGTRCTRRRWNSACWPRRSASTISGSWSITSSPGSPARRVPKSCSGPSASSPSGSESASGCASCRTTIPVRVAERVAMLDQLTDGRLEFGTGRSNAYEQIGQGIDPRDTRAMWEESITMLPRIWQSDEFSWEGQFWTVTDASGAAEALSEAAPASVPGVHPDRQLRRGGREGDRRAVVGHLCHDHPGRARQALPGTSEAGDAGGRRRSTSSGATTSTPSAGRTTGRHASWPPAHSRRSSVPTSRTSATA